MRKGADLGLSIFFFVFTAYSCQISESDYHGFDIRKDVVNNLVECQKRCQSMDDCAYWTYYWTNGECFLKYAAAKKNLRKTHSFISTGPKYCEGKHITKW